MLDTFHMNMEEFDMPGAIRRTGGRLVHFQANENNRGFVGSGHIDWPGIARALHDIAYKGPIVLEPFRRNDERAGVTLAQWRAPTRDEDRGTRRQHRLSARLRSTFAGRHRMSRLRIGWIGCGTHANEMLLPQLTRHDVRLSRPLRHGCRTARRGRRRATAFRRRTHRATGARSSGPQ